ncbi:DUF5077 domain-containing protein [Flavobacterium sp. P21]|uniref:DUF5077 domain-containing protein n=1 Tax=Flavobacterium sp. P21 TaxID=3423948 RepID=UPI003D67C0DD
MKNLFYLFFAFVLVSFSNEKNDAETTISIPLAGNAFSSEHIDGSNTITDNGIENWMNPKEFFTLYFKISKPGTFQISVEESVEVFGKSEVEFSINNDSKKVKFVASKKAVSIGTWTIKKKAM